MERGWSVFRRTREREVSLKNPLPPSACLPACLPACLSSHRGKMDFTLALQEMSLTTDVLRLRVSCSAERKIHTTPLRVSLSQEGDPINECLNASNEMN